MQDFIADFGPCPNCGEVCDAHLEVEPGSPPPHPGCAIICSRCATWAIVTDDLRLRMPTSAEHSAFEHSPLAVNIRGGLLKLIEERQR